MSAALLALGLAVSVSADQEPLELRLVRGVYLGVLSEEDARAAARHASDSAVDYTGHVLARAALAAAGRDAGFPEWPLEKLLSRTLDLLARETHAVGERPGLPDGFSGAHLVFTLLHALATSGGIEAATNVLEAQLAYGDAYGGDAYGGDAYKKGVVLQALRNLGTPRSTALLQRFKAEARARGDDHNLAENVLADQRYPFLYDLAERLPLIPATERRRERLLALAFGCTPKAALAVYFLGFLPDHPEPQAQAHELERLRQLTAAPCFWTRYFAVRALAIRSPETIAFWTERFRAEHDAWQRAQLARVCFARFGRRFLDPALALLAEEPSQYVQWELMHGNLERREGARYRSWWDLWDHPTLQFHLNFPAGGGEMDEDDVGALIAWLESGRRPQNEWVRNHLLYGLARHVRGPELRRFLRVFDALPEQRAQFWILTPLDDAQALPILRHWLRLEIPELQQRDALERLVLRLEEGRGATRKGCCQPTQACLLEWIETVSDTAAIASEAEAQAWLAGAPAGAPDVRFLDRLGRVASVRRGELREIWEHLYGCWVLSGPEAQIADPGTGR